MFKGIAHYEKQITDIDKRIKKLSVFDYSMSLIKRILSRGERKNDPAWQEIERLLEVRKDCELKLEELKWQVATSNLNLLEFYSFSIPQSAVIAVKKGIKPLTVYSRCVADVYNQKVLYRKLTVEQVREELRQSVCADTQQSLDEETIQDELTELGKYGDQSFYQGSVLLIENVLI